MKLRPTRTDWHVLNEILQLSSERYQTVVTFCGIVPVWCERGLIIINLEELVVTKSFKNIRGSQMNMRVS